MLCIYFVALVSLIHTTGRPIFVRSIPGPKQRETRPVKQFFIQWEPIDNGEHGEHRTAYSRRKRAVRRERPKVVVLHLNAVLQISGLRHLVSMRRSALPS
jgi:hypothetical protein